MEKKKSDKNYGKSANFFERRMSQQWRSIFVPINSGVCAAPKIFFVLKKLFFFAQGFSGVCLVSQKI